MSSVGADAAGGTGERRLFESWPMARAVVKLFSCSLTIRRISQLAIVPFA